MIYGAGASGKALCALLSKENTYLYDDNALLSQLSYEQVLSLLPSMDCLIISPGISVESGLCCSARKLHVRVIGEFEFSSRRCKARQIAVTGTNGKTTTTEMINHILTCCGIDSVLLGNGGVPLSTKCDILSERQTAVLEVSSFQLEGYMGYNPFVSAITNVAPDHLDRHGNFDDYKTAKSNVCRYQSPMNFTLYNCDDREANLLTVDVKSKRISFGAYNVNADCYFGNGRIICRFGSNYYEIKANIEHYACHNTSNMVCAAAVSLLCGAKEADVSNAINSFVFSPYRMQLVRTIDSVHFYNDSKGTNVHATLAAISSLNSVCLIMGGSDKGYDFDEIFSMHTRLHHVVCFGQTADKIIEAAKRCGYYSIDKADGLETAVMLSYLKAKEGADVLFSPACASFDQFANYIERGNKFTQIVNSI